MCVYLGTKFQVSSVILTSFRWGNFTCPSPHPPPPQNELLKSPPRLGLMRKKHKKTSSIYIMLNTYSF